MRGEFIMKRKRNQRKRYIYKQKLISALFAVLLAVMFSTAADSKFVRAGDSIDGTEIRYEKCYKSIVLEYGDTLWDIALQYKGSHYESVNDYIDEVMQINHLKTDHIHAGRYLTVPYYSPHNRNDYDENIIKMCRNTDKNIE